MHEQCLLYETFSAGRASLFCAFKLNLHPTGKKWENSRSRERGCGADRPWKFRYHNNGERRVWAKICQKCWSLPILSLPFLCSRWSMVGYFPAYRSRGNTLELLCYIRTYTSTMNPLSIPQKRSRIPKTARLLVAWSQNDERTRPSNFLSTFQKAA